MHRRRVFLSLMKKAALFLILFSLSSCAPGREETRPVRPPAPPLPQIEARVPSPPAPEAKRFRDILTCDDRTDEMFNRSGMAVLPFLRVVFADIDNDGREELIAGSKDGRLRLYRRDMERSGRWHEVEGYFDGIGAGAFSAPAVGDIDGDGKLEVVVGAGGFSSESGRLQFYRNTSFGGKPIWSRIELPDIDVGDDATPTLADMDGDGRPDLVIGNSAGNLFLYRNRSSGRSIAFVKDGSFFRGLDVGMYAAPAATVAAGRIIVIVGNSMGDLYLLEKTSEAGLWLKSPVKIETGHFAAPAFVRRVVGGSEDLVVADGNGGMHPFRNRGDYRSWDRLPDQVNERIAAGSAVAPSLMRRSSGEELVLGNINGELYLFSYASAGRGIPWQEKKGYFRNLKLPGFSRGSLALWQGRTLLVTGQQDGEIRAFLNSGTEDRPAWSERKSFFKGIPKIPHAAPVLFDLDGDGQDELIVGGTDGFVKGFRMRNAPHAEPSWEQIPRLFDYVKVGRYAVPALIRQGRKILLLVGQQDGNLVTFSYEPGGEGYPFFYLDSFLDPITVKNHSSPSVVERDGRVDLTVGDYDGNIRYFACRPDRREVAGP